MQRLSTFRLSTNHQTYHVQQPWCAQRVLTTCLRVGQPPWLYNIRSGSYSPHSRSIDANHPARPNYSFLGSLYAGSRLCFFSRVNKHSISPYLACTVNASAFTSNRISDSVRNLREVLFAHGNILGFRAYADFSLLSTSRETRMGLSSAGVTLIDCPTDQRLDLPARTLMRELSDSCLICQCTDSRPVDALLAGCEGRSPHIFAFVTSDVGLAPTLATLRMRKYQVILISPVSTAKDLTEQATQNYDLTRSMLGIGDGVFCNDNSPPTKNPSSFFGGTATYNGQYHAGLADSPFQRPIMETHVDAAGIGSRAHEAFYSDPPPATQGLADWRRSRRPSIIDPLARVANPRSRSNTLGHSIPGPSSPTSGLAGPAFLPGVEPFNPPLTPNFKGKLPEKITDSPRYSPPLFGIRRPSMAASHKSEVVSGTQYFSGHGSPPRRRQGNGEESGSCIPALKSCSIRSQVRVQHLFVGRSPNRNCANLRGNCHVRCETYRKQFATAREHVR